MKCRFCGQEMLEKAVYCNYCGKKVYEENHSISNDNNSQSVNNNTKKDSNKILSRLLYSVCLIITIIYCVDGIRGTNILKSIASSVKSEKTLKEISEDDENEVRAELEKYVIEQKETLPTTISDGMIMIDVELEGKMLVITTELEGVLPSDCTQQTADDAKEEILSSGVFNDDLKLLFRKFGYGIIYSYVNEYNEPLYKIHIYPHEL